MTTMSNEFESMTIGKLATAAGVGVETVRFYQRKGLLETPQRTAGYRLYDQSDVRTIKFVKRLQDLGFTLKEAQELLQLSSCSEKTRPILAKTCDQKIRQVEQKIGDLNRMLDLLRRFANTCGNEGSKSSRCSLIDCFENQWECCNSEKEI